MILDCFVQVVEKLIRGLAMEDSRNMFALFEHNNTIDRAVESRVLVADVLAKFERYVIHNPYHFRLDAVFDDIFVNLGSYYKGYQTPVAV